MVNRQILTSWYGKHYIIVSLIDAPVSTVLRAEHFFDLGSSEQFLRSLEAPIGYWDQLANECVSYADWRSAHYWSSVESFLARALVRGELAAFEVPHLQPQASSSPTATLKVSSNLQHRLLPASALLTERIKERKHFASTFAARNFLQSHSLSEAQLAKLTKSLPGSTGITPIEVLSQALVNGDVVVTVERISSAPPTPLELESAAVNSAPATPPPAPEMSEPMTPSPATPEEVASFLNDAQAAALMSAAEKGNAVCEQCEKD